MENSNHMDDVEELLKKDYGIKIQTKISLDHIFNEVEARKKRYRKTTKIRVSMGIMAVCVLLSVSTTSFANTTLINVITKFTHVTGRGGTLQGMMFKGGKSSAAFDEPASETYSSTGYSNEIIQKAGLEFPKLQYNGLNITKVSLEMINREYQRLVILSSGIVSLGGQINADITVDLSLYHNTSKDVVIDGSVIQSLDDNVNLTGTNAKYISSENAHHNWDSYLIWKRNDWTIVLDSHNVPKEAKETLVKIADTINNQLN